MIHEITKFLSVDNTFLEIFHYRMSYLEFFGTILNLWSVWLVTKNNILTWPVGNIAVILFGFLFYQIRLYSDLVEQLYFLITGFYGWWLWLYSRGRDRSVTKKKLQITYNSSLSNSIYLMAIIFGTLLMGYFMGHVHIYLPALFPEMATFPYVDAFTTVMSFSAQLLMAHRRMECWYLWIAVDLIGIWLYFVKGVVFVSSLYLIFLVLATKGLFNWRRFYNIAEQTV